MIEPQTHACTEFLADFSDFVDGRVSPARRAEIQVHLDCCERCLRHLSAYRRGVEAYRGITLPQVEGNELWMALKLRLADRRLVERPAARPPVARVGWRAPSLAGAAVAALALAVLWVGTWIGAGLDRVAESARQPVVVVAGPPAPVHTPAVEPDGTGRPSAPVRSITRGPSGTAPAQRATSRYASAAGEPAEAVGDLAAVADPAREREFEALRERIEIEAWLGDPRLAVLPAFEPAGIGAGPSGVRVTTADVRSAEPIPVGWAISPR